MFCEYSNHVGNSFQRWAHQNYPSALHNDHETWFENNECSLYCLENHQITSIEVKIKLPNSKPHYCANSFRIQIYIGPFLIFCSARDLIGLNHANEKYVMLFILYKLVYNNI